jgi:hypothetical protein
MRLYLNKGFYLNGILIKRTNSSTVDLESITFWLDQVIRMGEIEAIFHALAAYRAISMLITTGLVR